MAADPTSMRGLARRLLALEAASAAVTTVGEPCRCAQHEAVRVCDKLRKSVTRLAGDDGFASLLRRALVLARAEVPALDRITVNPNCAMEGIEALAASENDGGVAAASALTAHLLELLVTFIGEPLTLRLVREAWPDVALNEGHGPDQ